jgi:hypothetical protein
MQSVFRLLAINFQMLSVCKEQILSQFFYISLSQYCHSTLELLVYKKRLKF